MSTTSATTTEFKVGNFKTMHLMSYQKRTITSISISLKKIFLISPKIFFVKLRSGTKKKCQNSDKNFI